MAVTTEYSDRAAEILNLLYMQLRLINGEIRRYQHAKRREDIRKKAIADGASRSVGYRNPEARRGFRRGRRGGHAIA